MAKVKNGLTATAMIEVPVGIEPGFAVRHFNFRVSESEAKKIGQIKQSLHDSGKTYHDGRIQRHVDRPHDVFRWLLSQIDVA